MKTSVFTDIKSLFEFRKFGVQRWKNIFFIILYSIFFQNEKNNQQKIASYINNLGIVPTKLAQWCAYFCQIHFNDNVIVSSFKYLQTNCNENKNILLDTILKPFEDKLFSYEKAPFSVGSIAQIHRGKLKTGEEVVIKIKHDDIESDIQLWQSLFSSDIVFSMIKFFQKENTLKLNFTEFFENIRSQLNFDEEVKNQKKFYDSYKNNPLIQIPKYHMHNEKVIIMEYLPSMNFQEIQNDMDSEEKRYFLLLARILYQDNIFIKNIIHMDLHNGNWGINRSERSIVLYDFGWVLHEQSDFKRFFICAHLSRKQTLEYIVKRYNIKDNNKKLEEFVLTLSDKIDTIKAINLILREFQDEFIMDNFMFCVLSFCVFMGSISEEFEEFESYVNEELQLMREKELFVALRCLIEKFKDPDIRQQIDNFMVSC